jgi:hypothetical protein
MIGNKQVTKSVSHNYYYVNFLPGGMLRSARGVLTGMARYLAGGWRSGLAAVEDDLLSLAESLPPARGERPGSKGENH